MDLQPEGLVLRGNEIPKATIVALAGQYPQFLNREMLGAENTPSVHLPLRWIEHFVKNGVAETVRQIREGKLSEPEEVWTIPLEQAVVFGAFIQRVSETMPIVETEPVTVEQQLGAWADELHGQVLQNTGVSLSEFVHEAEDWAQAPPGMTAELLERIDGLTEGRVEAASDGPGRTWPNPWFLLRSRILLKIATEMQETRQAPLN